jgi:hypothetical protein
MIRVEFGTDEGNLAGSSRGILKGDVITMHEDKGILSRRFTN